MRSYTDDFPQELQDEFEDKIDTIIVSGTNLPAADIVNLLFVEWDTGLDTSVHMQSFIHALHGYLYTPADPFIIKSSVTGAGVLLFCMRRSFSHLVREDADSVAA